MTTAVLEAPEPVEGAFSLFFCNLSSHLSDFVGSLVPEVGSASFDSEPLCFSARVLLDPAENSSSQSFKLASKAESISSNLEMVVSFAKFNDSLIFSR